MPMMVADGFIDPQQFVHQVALLPGNADFGLQSVVSAAIAAAAITGVFSCGVSVSAYSATLIQLLMERLVNMGYTSTLSGTTLTVNW